MWPNMIRKQNSGKSKDTTSGPTIPFLPKQDESGEGVSLRLEDLNDEIAQSLFMAPEGGVSAKEIAALEAWLDGDPDVPWRPSKPNNSANDVAEFPSASHSNPEEGFDDDFADFVSAVAQIAVAPPGATDPKSISPSHSPSLLPSASEVQAASSRIFQPSQSSTSATLDRGAKSELEDEGPEPFDLNRILGVLSAMKDEISMIEDIEKRRKAAATAALGLVAGLGLESGVEDDASELGELVTVE